MGKIKGFIRERHWTTKLVWGAGLSLMFLTFLVIMIFPPGIAFQGYRTIQGKVVEQGVSNHTYSVSETTDIPCSEDCPFYGSKSGCGDGYCLRFYPVTDVIENSFLVKTLFGEERVVGDLNVGDYVSVAVKGNNVRAKGGFLLWDFQWDFIKGYLTGGAFKILLDTPGEWAALFVFLVFLPTFVLYFLVGFMVVDDFKVAVSTSIFSGYFVQSTVIFISDMFEFAQSFYLTTIPICLITLIVFTIIQLKTYYRGEEPKH
ncbi:hypothetical protein ACFLRF_03475 [Candidatus Altiarchaeota archaeon]